MLKRTRGGRALLSTTVGLIYDQYILKNLDQFDGKGVNTEKFNNGRIKTKGNMDKEDLKDSYARLLEIWKIHNENYFKRVQAVMAVLQVGLFVAIVKFLSPFPTSWSGLVFPTFIGIVGIISACLWLNLNEKQTQYLEFCRRVIRNLESKLISEGVPSEYFTVESIVFGPYFDKCPNTMGVTVLTKNTNNKKRRIAEFTWSGERYPEYESERKELHEIGRVRGGMVSFEKSLARGTRLVWIVTIIVLLITGIFSFTGNKDSIPQKENNPVTTTLPNQANAADH